MRPDRQASESFPIVPSATKTLVFVACVLAFCMIPIVATVSLFSQTPIVAIAWVVTVLTGGVVSYVGWSSRHVCFELSPAGLRVRNSFFGRTIPRSDLLPERGRTVSIPEEPQLKPMLRTFGSGLVGYCEGWFRLRNWEKALIFLTDRTRVVDLPTRKGYRLLLSVPDPQQFLDTARQLWGAPATSNTFGNAPGAAEELPAGLRGALEPR
jgi:hypothetical protein